MNSSTTRRALFAAAILLFASAAAPLMALAATCSMGCCNEPNPGCATQCGIANAVANELPTIVVMPAASVAIAPAESSDAIALPQPRRVARISYHRSHEDVPVYLDNSVLLI